MKKLYEYVIIHRPKGKKDEPTPEPVVVKDLQRVLAFDEREVLLKAAKQIPAELESKLEEVEVAIRPF